jgi:hypothetical protein
MKKLLMTMVAGFAITVSGNAFAQSLAPVSGGSATTVNINGTVAPQCKITGSSTASVTGTAAAGLADSSGFLSGASALNDILAGLTATNTTAWCSGVSTVVVSRTPLVRQGSTTGAIDASGFVNAIGYDVQIVLAGATRTSPFAGYDDKEGTSDGAGNGPTFNPFGPIGTGVTVTFIKDTWANPTGVFDTIAEPLNLTVSPSYDGPSQALLANVVPNTTRLAAGTYTGTVTLTLTPST